ncbi:MAG: hypothetical protein ACHQZS_07425 [Candidatus Binatales bacterium]
MPDVDNQIGVFVTLEAVFPGEEPSLDSLKHLLQDLNKGEVVAICSRLNLFISDLLNEGRGSWLERHVRKQWETATNFFRPEHLAKIEIFFRHHPGCSVVFRGQLLELIRWAVLYCRDEQPTDELANNLDKRDAFAKALLTVNGIWGKRIYRDQLTSGDDMIARRLRALPRFRRSLSETGTGPDLTQAFARGEAIIRGHLCRLYPDFGERFQAASGLTLDDYYACLLLLVFCSMGLMNTPVGTHPLGANRFFRPASDQPDLQRAITRMMESHSQSLPELAASLWKGKVDPTELDVAILEHKVFRDKPIVRLREDRAIVMDPMFLGDMLSLGPLFMSGDTEASLTQFGYAFERYCQGVFASMYPSTAGLACRLAPNTSGITASGGEVQLADVILDCGDKTILVETKASLIREDRIDSFDPDDYIAFLRTKYGISAEGGPGKKKGIAQLANSILKLAAGEWRQVDPSFPIRKRIIPVLLVHDPLIDAPLHPWFFAREFAGLLDRSNADLGAAVMHVRDYLVSNLIVMTIDDLESLESSVQTFGLCDLLQDYAVNRKDRMVSLHNYIVEDGKYREAIVYNNRLMAMFEKDLEDLGRRLGREPQGQAI